jgi:hypothetical protein
MDESVPEVDSGGEHEYTIGEKVYVFDENGFDIYEGNVEDIKNRLLFISYPEWPEDQGWVKRSRVIPITERNEAIFAEQQRIRKEKEEEEDEEEASEAYEAEPKKKAKPARKPREPKPPKEKKVKEPKEPKPPKAPKEKKPKIPKVKPEKKPKVKTEKRAKEETPKAPPKEPKRKPRGDQDSSDGQPSFSSSEESMNEMPEQEGPLVYDPEPVFIPDPEVERTEGIELRIPPTLPEVGFGPSDEQGDMAIRFNSSDCANCFIYRLESGEEYLILNGMKFRIKQFGEKLDNEGLYYEMKCRTARRQRPTEAVIYPAVVLSSRQTLVKPPECDQYLEHIAKEKRKKESVPLPEVQATPTASSRAERRPRRREREFNEAEFESSGSDD